MVASSVALCLILAASTVCFGSTVKPGSSASISRQKILDRINIVLRNQMNIPPSWKINIGERKPSDIPGYDTLEVVFSSAAEHSQSIPFLISKDGKRLARLSVYSLQSIPELKIKTAGWPVRGNKWAPVQIIVYDDLECPFCAELDHELFPATLNHYKGLVDVVYKDYPLLQIHPWAMHAAVDAGCLAKQSNTAYWGYVDYIHGHLDSIPLNVVIGKVNVIPAYHLLDEDARQIGQKGAINPARLLRCMQAGDQTAVRSSITEGNRLGISSTPVMFINGVRVIGAQPIQTIWEMINNSLRDKDVKPPLAPSKLQAR